MANYANLKAAIDTVIKANGQQEITGTVLNQTLTAMVNSLGAGYLFMGVAIPSTNPGTPDQNVFYLAGQAGTYSNFSSIVLQAGLSILKWNGTWSSETIFTFDSSLTENGTNPITSGAVFAKMKIDGGAYDVSAHNSNQTFASLSALLNDANLSTLIPTNIRSGGMSIKFIQTSDNKYVQYRLMSQTFSINEANWERYNDVTTSNQPDSDLDISDDNGNTLVRFKSGHIRTKNFDSSEDASEEKRGLMSAIDKSKLNSIEEGAEVNDVFTENQTNSDLDISDENGGILVRFSGGHIRTKNFDSSTDSSKSITEISYGHVSENGIIHNTKTRVLLKIKGGCGFFLKLCSPYKIHSVHLFDSFTDKLLVFNYCGVGSEWRPLQFGDMSYYGQDTVYNGLYLMIEIKQEHGEFIDSFSNIIETLDYLTDVNLHRWVINQPYFYYAHKRMRSISNITWKCLSNIESVTEYFSQDRFIKGNQYISVPYSDVLEYYKYVGLEVTPYTFMSASQNKRSVIYTEKLRAKTSQYGIIYNYPYNDVGCYYGAVCSSFTAAIMGFPFTYWVEKYKNSGEYDVPNLTTVSNANRNNIEPLDLIYYTGHIAIISDIYKDDYGNVKYILWAEYTYPNVFINIYTPEQFEERLAYKSAIVRRYSNWQNTCTDIDFPNFLTFEMNGYQKPFEQDTNIHLYTGNKSTYSLTEPIYININRTQGFDTLLVYKNDVQILNIDISNLPNDGLYPEDEEDWVKYDMRINTLSFGTYKARLYNSISGEYSGYVEFEILDTHVDFTIENSTITRIDFSSANCNPTAIMSAENDFYPKGYTKILSQQEVVQKYATLDISKNISKYIVVCFKGVFGGSYNRIDLSSI